MKIAAVYTVRLTEKGPRNLYCSSSRLCGFGLLSIPKRDHDATENTRDGRCREGRAWLLAPVAA